jgi:hypothetical protein
MGKWLRVDALFRQHPKFISAGHWGSQAVQAAWEIAKAYDCPDGDVTQYWKQEYISWWLHADAGDLDSVQNGMERAETSGLIERSGDRVLIHDWRDHQPETSTERVRRHRKKQRKQQKQDETVSKQTETVLEQDETVSRVAGNVGTTNRTDGTNIQNTQHTINNNINKSAIHNGGNGTTTKTPESEAKELEALRTVVSCVQCGKRWMLIRGINGDFYGHGRTGSATGCRATCSVEEYKEIQEKQPAKLCSICGKYVVQDGSDICAPCMVTDGNHGL